ncbi:methyltransferase small [Niastella koreensis GR20-10]|uniref:Methyltransferase small n=1 Tax=Niastella koreensis (strain DSM 17620 / KACC 11465 / NBRC 106392 / GR20-10) TaxID=700598 RepID=G8TFZ7_NIAKG|nr:methyltransferase [Niastella koreensis]AEW00596.1 methyltransferase small [Niastella koreensis GR20-10]
MRRAIKQLTTRLYKPLLVKYLSATRLYTYKGIRLVIPPAVFHPGFFFSTRLLLRYIASLPLKNKFFLELGAGSGLIAMYAARQEASVTATDINPVAIHSLEMNARSNRIPLTIIKSDLFTGIPQQAFDIIAINPPYYKKQPQTGAEYAWYCGEQGEYFQQLFGGLHQYIHEQSVVLMVLCDGCDIDMIKEMALNNGFKLNCVFTKGNWVEVNYIFKVEK